MNKDFYYFEVGNRANMKFNGLVSFPQFFDVYVLTPRLSGETKNMISTLGK